MSYTLLLPQLWNQSDPNTLCPPWYKDGGDDGGTPGFKCSCQLVAVDFAQFLFPSPQRLSSNVM